VSGPGPDAVVVGSGPNGLAAAITLARAGRSVVVYEGAESVGGGCRTEAVTMPGFRHDICASVHPLAMASPFLRTIDLERHGVTVRLPEVQFANPLDGGRAAIAYSSVAATAEGLGVDRDAYARHFDPLVARADAIVDYFLSPLRTVPRHPFEVSSFAVPGLLPAAHTVRRFGTDEAKALFAGAAAHAMVPLTRPLTTAYGGLFTTMAHRFGWPVIAGGSDQLVAALISELRGLGGEVETGHRVRTLDELPKSNVVLFDTSPRGFLSIVGDRVPGRYRRALTRFRHGPGVCKVDWALDGPVPWANPEARRALTLHLGGTFEETARSEAETAAGRHPEHPYCIIVQAGVVDPTRAPDGKHTLWGYCHVPNGSNVDMTDRIEQQIERYAAGFRDLVLARTTRTATAEEEANPNYVGGDINGGAASLLQTFARPALRWDPYRTPVEGLYLCSASTPPGGGVHGMCGMAAARSALRHSF
jgi:phytoene dehydrogenase-like protein